MESFDPSLKFLHRAPADFIQFASGDTNVRVLEPVPTVLPSRGRDVDGAYLIALGGATAQGAEVRERVVRELRVVAGPPAAWMGARARRHVRRRHRRSAGRTAWRGWSSAPPGTCPSQRSRLADAAAWTGGAAAVGVGLGPVLHAVGAGIGVASLRAPQSPVSA
jgi:hypothetical protein